MHKMSEHASPFPVVWRVDHTLFLKNTTMQTTRATHRPQSSLYLFTRIFTDHLFTLLYGLSTGVLRIKSVLLFKTYTPSDATCLSHLRRMVQCWDNLDVSQSFLLHSTLTGIICHLSSCWKIMLQVLQLMHSIN